MRALVAVLLLLVPAVAGAQSKPTPPSSRRPAAQTTAQEPIGIRGFVTFGSFRARSSDTFEAVLGSNVGPIVGGGAQVLLPYGLYVEVSASRFRRDGGRVFIGPNQEVFPLGIPLEVSLTPLEFTGGWRYRHCPRTLKGRASVCRPSVVPYVGGGFSSFRYQETSDFGDAEDDVNERFNGFHLVGGVEYRAMPWLSVGGELGWSSVPDALGGGGVSAAFNENDLGGAAIRLKINIGR